MRIDALCARLETVEKLRREDVELEEMIAGYHLEAGLISTRRPAFVVRIPRGK